MEIKGSNVMILGAYGEVGTAITKAILKYEPSRLYISSLNKREVEELVRSLPISSVEIVPIYGNIFVRQIMNERTFGEIFSNKEDLTSLVEDTFGELTEEALSQSTLFRLITVYSPDIVIDCVNTATALAYRDIYFFYEEALKSKKNSSSIDLYAFYRTALASGIPLLIRHVQILYEALRRANVKVYVKVGTTGTGGMGFNIPFTHGEEIPSRLLLMKAALAGAHSMLLYIMSKTPGSPVIKEVKPATMIAWKKIGKGVVTKDGRPLKAYDFHQSDPFRLKIGSTFSVEDSPILSEGGFIEGTFIDTGENGVFSTHEFKVVSALGLMEFVTPEEVAAEIIESITGKSGSRDVIGALHSSVLHSTYRAGVLREAAIKKMDELGEEGYSYGLLGPRVSKLIFEAGILKASFKYVEDVLEEKPSRISKKIASFLLSKENPIRREALSVGIPILLPDGQSLIFANRERKDKAWEMKPWEITEKNIETFAEREWIDTREKNVKRWQKRMRDFLLFSKRGSYPSLSMEDGKTIIDPGELAAFVLIHEFGGGRSEYYTGISF